MWQWRESPRDEWQFYSDIENAIIEDVYNVHGKQVKLDNNIKIDLKKNIQIDENKKNNKSLEIRRLDDSKVSSIANRQRRNDRFCSTPKMISNNTSSNTSFAASDWNGSRFVFEWHMKCVDLETLPYGSIMGQALQGILLEGNQIGYGCQAQWIYDHYISITTNESFEKIGQACIRIYTMESFLYRLVNMALRDNDLSKVDTLGPFCYLLFQFYFAQEFKDLQFSGRVYRGANLSSSQIAEYERAIGSLRSWLGLTSTTQQKQVAESFPDSTVLFIIDIQKTAFISARTIANLSIYPYEDEVLIRAGSHFIINKIESNPSSNNNIKTFIYLTIE